jgi:NitT/TauT family transport system substrate-binding protein
MFRKLRSIGGALAAGVMLVSFAGCSPDSATSSSTASGGETTTVKVGTLKNQPHLYEPYFYGKFAPKGVKFETVLFDSSPDIKNAVVSGAVDFGVEGAASAISGASAGQDIKIVASATNGGSDIVGKPEITSLNDLKGKKVGYPKGSTQEILLYLTLQQAGIDMNKDLQLVNLPFSDMATAYESGRVDAFISAENGPAIAKTKGAHEIASPYNTPLGKANIVLTTTGKLIKSKPDLVQSVVKTHAKAVDYMAAHPDDVVAGVSKTFGVDQAVVKQAVNNIWPSWKISDDYKKQLESTVSEMVKFKQIEKPVELTTLVDDSFISKIS